MAFDKPWERLIKEKREHRVHERTERGTKPHGRDMKIN